MANENDKLQKTPGPSEEGPRGIVKAPTGGIKISGRSRLHSALAGAPKEDINTSFQKAAEAAVAHTPDKMRDPLTATNRIAIMADCSGSMSDRVVANKSKMDLTHEALTGFINQVDFDTTSIAIYTFPFFDAETGSYDNEDDATPVSSATHGVKYKFSFDKLLLTYGAQSLRVSGSTPMHRAMQKVIDELPLTRGIIISDGDADSSENALEQAHAFARSETIIDTVHIGMSSGGERLLQQIAQITGGMYIKFDNVQNFAKAFAFLTPEGRATLMLNAGPGGLLSGEAKERIARQLGAKEIK